MCIFVYYHLTIMRNWRDIVREQCTRIVFSGLYASVTEIRCYAIIPDGNMTLMTECEETLKRYGNKFALKGFAREGNEWFTLSKLCDITGDDDYVLYIHTKGVTRFGTNEYTHKGRIYKIPNLYDNILDWRDLMEYFLIGQYERCIDILKNEADTVGINVFTGTPVHYAGNFFWMKGSHLKTLNYEGDHNPETWIFENTIGRFVSIYQSSLPDIRFPYLGIGHYFKEYPLSMVVDTDQLNG